MSKFKKIRAWANKDNGSVYQIGNRNLSVLEIICYFFFIAAGIVSVLHDKLGFKETWLGWAFLVTSFILVIIGTSKSKHESHV